MTKTLNDAIGCWTVNREYNSLETLADMVKESAKLCRRYTLKGDPIVLKQELRILRARLDTMTETTNDAMRRLEEIIVNKELSE